MSYERFTNQLPFDGDLGKINARIEELNKELAGLGENADGEFYGEGNTNRSKLRRLLDERHTLDSGGFQNVSAATLEDSRRAVDEAIRDVQQQIREKMEERGVLRSAVSKIKDNQ
jgi:hypothetical protein